MLTVVCALVLSACSLPQRSDVDLRGPEAAGGDGTVRARGAGAFSEPAANLTDEEVAEFLVGDRFFTEAWTPAGEGPADQDGLGPTFLTTSCEGCHPADGRGSAPGEAGAEPLLRFVDSDGSATTLDAYGVQVQRHALGGVPAEANVEVTWKIEDRLYPDGTPYSLRSPIVEVAEARFGDIAEFAASGVRIGPPLIGLGLLEAIDEAGVRANADADDTDRDGISGIASNVPGLSGSINLGRFGLKANLATIADQAAVAYLLDLGITTPAFPNENCPSIQTMCGQAPTGGTPEISRERLAAVVFYLQTLAVPARIGLDDASVVAGESIFHDLGCAACHVPMWETGDHPVEALAQQTIYPYTDLLLHDMGRGLSDGRADGSALASEWRTAPLWGLGFTKAVNPDAGFLHDGRARSIEEAVLWHGGEAESARLGFLSLTAEQRQRLLHFLKSL